MKEKIQFDFLASRAKTPIEKTVKAMGLDFPNTSLGFLHATYAKFEEANKNSVMLASSVKDDLNKLKQTQVNFSHKRAWNICGTILNAWVNEETNEIEIVFTFHKSVYPEKWKEALELLNQGKLTVSFELMVEKKDIELIEGGVKKLHRVDFDGVGLLMGEKPAYPNAYVLETAKVEQTVESPELIYAKEAEKEIFEKLEKGTEKKEEYIVDEKNQKKLFEAYKNTIIAEFGDAVEGWSDEDLMNDEKIQALRESLKTETEESEKTETEEASTETKEEKTETENAGENKEEVQAEQFTETTERKEKVEVTYDTEAQTETVKKETEAKYDNGDGYTVEKKENSETVYTYAQVEEIKKDYESKLEAKDQEITFIKENAQKVIELRAELGEFAKELSDEDLMNEDKLKIARLEKKCSDLESEKSSITAEDKSENKEILTATEETNEEAEETDEEKKNKKDQALTAFLKAKHGK